MNFIFEEVTDEENLRKEQLSKLVIPCWNNVTYELALELINKDLVKIEGLK